MNELISIQRRLSDYNCKSARDEDQALREILQELILAALGRTEFFCKAAFHGRTQLRIFHGLKRFSEDLDFALKEENTDFSFAPYLDKVKSELESFGVMAEITDRSKADSTVKKAFLKDDSIIRILNLRFLKNIGSRQMPRKLRSKLEVDSRPPTGATYESLPLAFPVPASVTAFDLPSSFAGKMHALLCREYVKGRDWYDLIWYCGSRVKLNHELLSSAIDQNGPWAGQHIKTSNEWVREELKNRIVRLNWQKAREDVEPFIHETELESLQFFTAEYFTRLADGMMDPAVARQKSELDSLIGTWGDNRTAGEIIDDIYSARTPGREVTL